MRRRTLVPLYVLLGLLAFTTAANSADDYWDHWYWDCRVSTDPTAGDILLYGVLRGNIDGYEGEQLAHDGYSPVHAGVYHENGADGWTGPTGFYAEDFRAPVPLTPGSTKSWLINVWADPSLDPGVSTFTFTAQIAGILPPRDFRYTLTLLKKPEGVENGPAVGTSYDMSYYTFNWGAGFELPACRTDDGRNGYLVELRATAVPEPSSLLALLGGICGACAMIRRRTRQAL